LSDFNERSISSAVSKNTQTSNSIKFLPFGAELFFAYRPLIVAFRNFAEAPENIIEITARFKRRYTITHSAETHHVTEQALLHVRNSRTCARGRDSKKERVEQRTFLIAADKPATSVWIDRTATRTRANDRVTESTRVHSLLRGRENRTYRTAEYSSVACFRHPKA
jgi:hypothetical protein